MKRALCLVCLLFCLFWGMIQSMLNKPDIPYEKGKTIRLVGRIYDDEMTETGIRLYLTDVSQETYHDTFKNDSFKQFQPLHTNIKVYLKQNMSYRVGETVVVTGVLEAFQESTNEGQFDQKSYMNAQGIGLQMKQGKIIWHSQAVRKYDYALSILKKKWRKVYQKECHAQAGALIAILLGEKSFLDNDLKELYQRNGISHVMAISGLHVSFLGLLLFRIGRKLRLPLLVNLCLCFVVLFSYGKMTGMSASTIRALLMLVLLLLAQLFGRTYDMMTAMSVSLLCIVLINPAMFCQCGFRLSFVAVAGMGMEISSVLEYLFLVKYIPNPFRKIASAFMTSLGISLFTLPVLLYSYYSFSPYSVLLNLFVVPSMSLVLILGLIGGIWGLVFPIGAFLFLRPAEWILCCYEWICTLAQQLPNAVWIIGKPALWQILLYYVLLCTGLYLCKEYLQKEREQAQKCRQWLKPIYGLCSILILLSILIIPVKIACAARTTVTMLDVGQGDCFCVQLKGTVFMIDAGSSSETEIAKYKIEPFLKSQGIDKVDYMMASHADKDHINGLSECLSNSLKSGITYEHLVLTKYAADCREEYTELLRAAEKAGCEVMFIAKGDSFRIGEDIELTCLHPLKGAVYGEQNDSSMVLLLECMDTSMLFTGDISQKEEAAVVEALEQYRKNTHVDYLKTAHHGSKYSTSADFLKRVSPEYAFISCGKENRYGHPHEELIFRLQDSGCELFLTPESGAVERRLDVNNKGSHS